MGGKLQLIRDVMAYLLIGSFFLIFFRDSSSDEQWMKGLEHMAPVYLLSIFSLCGLFYYRSVYFSIISKWGFHGIYKDKNSNPRKAVRHRMITSWLMFLLAFLSMSAFILPVGEEVEYAENDDGTYDYSTIVYASPIVIDCDYNEECVVAKSLEKSHIFSFLAPEYIGFESGDPNEYHQVTEMISIPLFIATFWCSILIWFWIYDYFRGNLPSDKSGSIKWSEYYDKKSYHSYGAFLLCLASLLPVLFLVTNKGSSLNVVGAIIVLSSVIMLFYLCRYFYSYNQNDFFDARVPFILQYYPSIGMLIISVMGLLYSWFAAPVNNVNDIWLLDWILEWGEYGFFDSDSYRYSLANLLTTGLLGGSVLTGLLAIVSVKMEHDKSPHLSILMWFWILVLGLVFMGGAILLGLYGSIAMLFIEIISFNFMWLTPVLISIASLWLLRIQFVTLDAWEKLGLVNNIDIEKEMNIKQQAAQAERQGFGPLLAVPPLKERTPRMQVYSKPKKSSKYSSGSGYGVHLKLPDYFLILLGLKTVLLGPTNPRSGWDDLPSLWPAFTKKELILILKLFNLDSSGNKPILVERCAINIQDLGIRRELWARADDRWVEEATTLYNPTTLTELLAERPRRVIKLKRQISREEADKARARFPIENYTRKPENLIQSQLDQPTDLLGQNESSKPSTSKPIIKTDSTGIITITTSLSVVTIDKNNQEVEKIPTSEKHNQMFYQEINIMKSLDDNGIEVGLLDYETGANPKIVIRYFGSYKLGDGIESMNDKGKINIISKLIERVVKIHKVGWVHRDLKPDNILIDYRKNGDHRFVAIIDYGIAMKINRKQSETYNTAGTIFFGHSTQKVLNFNASTGQDWFSLARIFALLLRGTTIDSLDAEIQMSQTGLNMHKEIKALDFNDKVVDSMTELIIQSTKPSCEQHESVEILARIGKELTNNF